MTRIMNIGKHFKTSVMGYDIDAKVPNSGFHTEIFFESHADSEKKGNKKKLVV